MNAQLMNRASKSVVAGQARVLMNKAATAQVPARSVPDKSARLRETTPEQRHRVIAGVPYYRGLRWDL